MSPAMAGSPSTPARGRERAASRSAISPPSGSAKSKRRGKTPPDDYGVGRSGDGTLAWDWKVDSKGARQFRTFLWNGARFEQVVHDQAAAQ